MLKKLKNLLKENNRIIASHTGADYNYISREEDLTKSSYRVPVENLTNNEVDYFVNCLEAKNFTFHK